MRIGVIKPVDDLGRLLLVGAELIGRKPRLVDAIAAALLDPVEQRGDGVDQRIVEIEGDRLHWAPFCRLRQISAPSDKPCRRTG
jgi:hypothetical protein